MSLEWGKGGRGTKGGYEPLGGWGKGYHEHGGTGGRYSPHGSLHEAAPSDDPPSAHSGGKRSGNSSHGGAASRRRVEEVNEAFHQTIREEALDNALAQMSLLFQRGGESDTIRTLCATLEGEYPGDKRLIREMMVAFTSSEHDPDMYMNRWETIIRRGTN